MATNQSLIDILTATLNVRERWNYVANEDLYDVVYLSPFVLHLTYDFKLEFSFSWYPRT